MEEQILEADKLYDEGEYAECKRRLLDMLSQEPGFGRAHHLIGCLYYYVLDDRGKAASHLNLAVRFAPGYAAAYVNYARLLNSLNRHQELMELVMKGLNVEGMNKCVLLVELAKSHELNGDLQRAMDCYYQAERFAVSRQELEEVLTGIRRIRSKKLRPLKRLLGIS